MSPHCSGSFIFTAFGHDLELFYYWELLSCVGKLPLETKDHTEENWDHLWWCVCRVWVGAGGIIRLMALTGAFRFLWRQKSKIKVLFSNKILQKVLSDTTDLLHIWGFRQRRRRILIWTLNNTNLSLKCILATILKLMKDKHKALQWD